MNFEIVVVASRKRRALILDHLKNIPHKVSYTPDYDLPEDFNPTVVGRVLNHIGAYRCFKGHQDAIELSEKENVLIFEDDAVPNIPDWLDVIQDSISYLNKFELVSFHGRAFYRLLYDNYREIRPGNNFLVLKKKEGVPFICGALAYLVNKKSFEQILSWTYNGMPIDLLLYDKLNFCLLEKSPFDHDRSQGSLID